MLKEFWVDMHIHTCLSPCADSEMKPSSIVRKARERNLDIIGIADHNASENVIPVKRCGEKEGLKVIGGMEITSREEVHILGFFDERDALKKLQEAVYENLPGENDEDSFGPQIIIDEFDRAIGHNNKLLIGATTIGVGDIVNLIHNLGGIAIASHVDREGFGIIGQLGFIPAGLELDALELSLQSSVRNPQFSIYGFPLVSFSDAHHLEDIGANSTKFIMQDAHLAEIKKALFNKDGRRVLVP